MSTRHFEFWPRDVPQSLTLPQTSLWYNLEVSARRYPDKACCIFYDSVLSYAEVFAQAEQLAGYLQQRCGVKRGDRVGLYMQNSPAWVVAFYAVLRADAMVVPINPMNQREELDYMLSNSGARVIVAAQELLVHVTPLIAKGTLAHTLVCTYSDWLTVKTDLKVPDFVAAKRELPNQPGIVALKDAIDEKLTPGPSLAGPDDYCVLPYTSGTTGFPKGCIHTHRTVMHTAVGAVHWQRRYHDECVLTVLPLFHVTGLQNSMNGPIYSGATMVLLPRWDRAVAAQLIERYRITGFTAVPAMIVDLLSSPESERYDLSSLRALGGGGAAMPEAIAKKLEERFKITYLEGYGLSETIAATHINPPDRPKAQCLGIPIFDVESRVVSPGTVTPVGPGETGEIITHGPQVFLGYWQNAEADAESFVEVDGKRFFRTGDLARVDDDGYFFLVDRLKRMINAAGYKVWPAEVESMLYGHPGIKEACVIAQRDTRRGETVKAVVVPQPGTELTEDGIIAWARDNMAAYKVPRAIELAQDLPRSGSGKILWRVLQEREDEMARA
jgi:fatty-acyl-CoA synthase